MIRERQNLRDLATGNGTVVIKTREVLDQVEVKAQGNRSPFHTCVAEGLSEVPPSGC